MPVVLAPIVAVVVGFAALLILYGLYLLIESIVRVLDNLLGVNWFQDALQYIRNAVNYVINTLFGWLVAVVREVGSWFTAIPRAIQLLADKISEALASHARWIRNLAFTAIPQIWDWITRAVGDIYRWASNYISQAISSVYAWAMTQINSIYRAVSGWINSVYAWAAAQVNSLYKTVSGWISGVYAWATAQINSLYKAVTGWINGVYAWAVTQLGLLQRWVQGLVTTAIRDVFNAAIDWARKYADQAIGALVNALAIAAALPLAPAWPRVNDAIEAIAKAIPGSLAAGLLKIGAIPRALPKSLAGILAAVGALAAVGVDWIKECGVPLCRRLGGFGGEIEALQDELLILDLLELAEAVISDPRGAAADAAVEFGATVSEVAKGALDAIGAR